MWVHLSSYRDSNMSSSLLERFIIYDFYAYDNYIHICNNMSVYIILYFYIHILIKEWVKRSQFSTLNYGDFIVWSFETYGTQRWAIVVCSNIDFIYVLVKDNRIKEKN